MLKVSITHDVDRIYKSYQYITHLLSHLRNFNSRGVILQIKSFFKKNTYWNFEDILDIENKYNVKSTFFFLNETIGFEPLNPTNWPLSLGRYNTKSPKIIDIIQKLDKKDWEIAVQGSYNSYKDQELLKNEKSILEEIVGHKIAGVRQHYLNFDENTWKIQQIIGFKYDSSFGFADQVGYKNSQYGPFRPFNDHFMVFPLVIMDGPFMNLGKDKWKIFHEIIHDTRSNDALLVVDWHTNNFSKYDFPDYRDTFIEMIERLISEGSKFFTLEEYYHHQELSNLPAEKLR